MKVHFIDTRDPVFTIGFSAAFKLAFEPNRIHEGTGMWVLPHYVNDTLANVLNSFVRAKSESTL